jgi:hypothetical protein
LRDVYALRLARLQQLAGSADITPQPPELLAALKNLAWIDESAYQPRPYDGPLTPTPTSSGAMPTPTSAPASP